MSVSGHRHLRARGVVRHLCLLLELSKKWRAPALHSRDAATICAVVSTSCAIVSMRCSQSARRASERTCSRVACKGGLALAASRASNGPKDVVVARAT
jgi:hypothetical protein